MAEDVPPQEPRPAWSRESALIRLPAAVSLDDLSPSWAWGGSTGKGARVAVIDSGIEADHPDLEGCVDVGGGVAALLGQETGAVLEGAEDLAVLVLDDEDMAGVAARFPSVAAALAGRPSALVPAGGRRLSRMTMAFSIEPGPPARAVGGPDEHEVRRITGAFPALRP